jgi:hypothetical protein
MAKIVFSAIVGDARKKIGGNVFTKGRSGAFVRRKVSPTQPRTSAQRNARASFTDLSKAWSGASMDDTKRAGWNALASNYPVKDKFGASHTLTGLQMFQKLNRVIATIGGSLIYTPPASLAAGYPGAIAVAQSALTNLVLTQVAVTVGNAVYSYSGFTGAGPQVGASVTISGFATSGNNVTGVITHVTPGASGDFTLNTTTQTNETHAGAGVIPQTLSVTPATVPAGTETAVIFAAAQASAGRQAVGNKYRFLAAYASSGPWNILAAYQAKFGSLISGKKVGILVKYATTLTGAVGTPSSALQVIS